MAERSQFWQTGTGGDGATAITDVQTRQWSGDLFAPAFITSGSNPHAGIVPGCMSELAVRISSGNAEISAGAALADGFFYRNDSTILIALPVPAVATRIDVIALRADYATQTVRTVRIAGVEGGTPPALTQSAGVLWEVAIGVVQTTTGGIRTFHSSHIETRVRAYSRGYPYLVRQGGLSLNWLDRGTTNYPDNGRWITQVGAATVTAGNMSVTFPIPFLHTPLFFLGASYTSLGVTPTTATAGGVPSSEVSWMAIGPI